MRRIKKFTVGASFMAVFGIVDNAGLFLGMSFIEEWLSTMGMDSQIIAGLGNTFSDILGVVLGGSISTVLYRVLKMDEEGTFAENLVGITIGCLIPVFIRFIFIITI